MPGSRPIRPTIATFSCWGIFNVRTVHTSPLKYRPRLRRLYIRSTTQDLGGVEVRGEGRGVPPGSFIVSLHLTFNYNNFSFKLTHRFNVSFWKQINRPTRELNPRCCHQRRRFYIWTLASTATNNEFSCHTNTTVSAARFTGVTLSFVVGYSNHLTALPLFRKHVLSATPINSQRQFR